MAPSSARTRAPRSQDRYQSLLGERLRVARALYRAISHPRVPAARTEALALLDRARDLDRALDRLQAYQGRDYLRLICSAEDTALHAPGTSSDCGYCRDTHQPGHGHTAGAA